MFRARKFQAFLPVLVVMVVLSVSGCTIQAGVQLKPNSQFTYPNSNVTPIGRVTGEASATSFFIPSIMDPDLEEAAVQMALAQKGGDVLLDYKKTVKVTWVPLFLINIYTTTVTVDGTAAKMTIGKQKLR